jgi:fructose-specific phosphotransferase system IIC component
VLVEDGSVIDTPDPDVATSDLRVRWVLVVAGGLALVVTGLLATLGSFGANMAVMTDCTNSYDCSGSGCAPCDTTAAWLTSGWVVQGVLLVAAVAAMIAISRRRRPRLAATCAVIVVALAVGSFALTTSRASRSYCQPGEQVTLSCAQ